MRQCSGGSCQTRACINLDDVIDSRTCQIDCSEASYSTLASSGTIVGVKISEASRKETVEIEREIPTAIHGLEGETA